MWAQLHKTKHPPPTPSAKSHLLFWVISHNWETMLSFSLDNRIDGACDSLSNRSSSHFPPSLSRSVIDTLQRHALSFPLSLNNTYCDFKCIHMLLMGYRFWYDGPPLLGVIINSPWRCVCVYLPTSSLHLSHKYQHSFISDLGEWQGKDDKVHGCHCVIIWWM